MKRLLLPLLAALALPTAVNAQNYKLYNPKIESPDAFINTGTNSRRFDQFFLDFLNLPQA